MQNAVAFTDNDVIVIAWSYDAKPEGCMGFAIYRVDDKGKETPLPSFAVFKGDTIKTGQTTADFPVQKFYWKDPYARLVAEQTGNRTFSYKIVPLQGEPGKLKPMANLPAVTSNAVDITAELSKTVHAYFNRGLISTQRVSRVFKGDPNKTSLLKMVADPKNPLRASLAGDMVAALLDFADRAKTSGKIYAALYELHDDELIQKLVALGNRLSIVLSDAPESGEDEDGTKTKVDGNQGARDKLAASGCEKHDRIMPSNHIGHNKFLVYVDEANNPQAVLLGSTNWTSTGLCTQTNNSLVIDDSKLAAHYLDYWKKLAADTDAANGVAKNLQATALRDWDAQGATLDIDGDQLESWFSPNTHKARPSKTAGEQDPPDMQDIADRISKAKHAVLFLAFYPGTPSIVDWAADALKNKQDLFVRGCLTNKASAGGFYYELKGTTPPKKVPGEKTPLHEDPRVIGAEAFDSTTIPEGWIKEILSAGFAIIHDKVLVIDPFADDCVVITGSHNLGYKASFNNDENLVIVQGNKPLALAYTTHILDVYDHFSFRYLVKQNGPKAADESLAGTADAWLSKYYDDKGQIKNAQLKFWMQASPPDAS